MIESGDQVQDSFSGEGYGVRAVLDPAILDAIREANGAFLSLLAARAQVAAGEAVYGLEAGCAARTMALGDAARRLAASCPYTLFDLRFDDAPFWQGVVRASGSAGSACASDEATFARTAIFLAWHLVRSSSLQASLALGMGRPAQDAWRVLPLSALDSAATLSLPHLTARWGERVGYWSKLLVGTSEPDARLDAARRLGLQLLAADGMHPRLVRPERNG